MPESNQEEPPVSDLPPALGDQPSDSEEPCQAQAPTSTKEECNGIDDDCDGKIDDLTRPCYTGPKGTAGVGTCREGVQRCQKGQWGACIGEVTPANRDVCEDNNCDGQLQGTVERCHWASALPIGLRMSPHFVVHNSGNVWLLGQVPHLFATADWRLKNLPKKTILLLEVDALGRLQRVQPLLGVAAPGEPTSSIKVSSFYVTAQQDLIIAGKFSGALFNPLKRSNTNMGFEPSKGANDVFVSKVTSEGKVLWLTTAGDTQSEDITSIIPSDDGGSYVLGSFYAFTSIGTLKKKAAVGGLDLLVAKLDQDGKWSWVKTFGGVGSEKPGEAQGLVADPTGVYITGSLGGSSRQKPAAFGEHLLPIPREHKKCRAFVAHLSPKGEVLWARSATSEENADHSEGRALTFGEKGVLYVGGVFDGKQVRFFDAPESLTSQGVLQDTGPPDIFVARLNTKDGKASSSGQLGTKGQVRFGSIEWAPSVGLYVSGTYNNTMQLATKHLTSREGNDVFIATWSLSNRWVWGISAGGSSASDYMQRVIRGPQGKLYALGTFSLTALFDEHVLTVEEPQRPFLWKLKTSAP